MRKGTMGYAFAVLAVAGLAVLVLVGMLFGVGAVIGR
jgi:hypothetical protein